MAATMGQNKVWKPIVSYGGMYSARYVVSQCGEIGSTINTRGNSSGVITELQQYHDDKGYRTVTLWLACKRKTIKVHKLVAETWIGLRPDNLQINHIDGDKDNNNFDNLEYLTNAENAEHAVVTFREATLTFLGQRMSIRRALELYGDGTVSFAAAYRRIHRLRWSPMQAVTTPIKPTGRPHG